MKRIQKIFLVSMAIALIGVAVPIFLMFFGPDRIEFSGKTADEFFSGEDWIPIVVVPVAILIVIASIIPFIKILFPAQIKNGERAKATILKVWDTGVTINDNPQIGLLLEFLTKEGVKLQVEAKTIVSRLNVALVQPGLTADVVYDPQNTKRIQVLEIDTSTGSDDSVENRLTQISNLRDKGLLTEEEYKKKREEIIKSI